MGRGRRCGWESAFNVSRNKALLSWAAGLLHSLLTALNCLDSSHDLTAADGTEAAWARWETNKSNLLYSCLLKPWLNTVKVLMVISWGARDRHCIVLHLYTSSCAYNKPSESHLLKPACLMPINFQRLFEKNFVQRKWTAMIKKITPNSTAHFSQGVKSNSWYHTLWYTQALKLPQYL